MTALLILAYQFNMLIFLDKTITACPPRPDPGTESGGATYQEENDPVAVLQER